MIGLAWVELYFECYNVIFAGCTKTGTFCSVRNKISVEIIQDGGIKFRRNEMLNNIASTYIQIQIHADFSIQNIYCIIHISWREDYIE